MSPNQGARPPWQPPQSTFFVALAVAAVLGQVSPVAAQYAACDAETVAWVEACAREEGIALEASRCDEGLLVVAHASGDDGVLQIEVRPGAGGFRRAGDVGVSPIGEFSDWLEVPASWQRALDATVACATRSPPSPASSGIVAGRRGERPTTTAPIVPALGLAGWIALLVLDRRRVRVALAPRRWPALAVAVLALPVLTLIVRRLIIAPSFFHPNGQGPLWIDYALCEPSYYGPGYHELFSAPAVATLPTSEEGVFAAQAALGSLAPLAVFLIARAVGARRSLALCLAGLTLLDPLLARITQTESYFAAQGSLLVLAAGVLVWGMSIRRRSARHTWALRGLAILAAGLFVAAAAPIHPIAWIPAALTTLPVMATRGGARDVARRTAIAIAGVGTVALVLTGPTLLEVLRGSFFEQWGGSTRSVALPWRTLLYGLPLVLVPASLWTRARLLLLGGVVAFVIAHAERIAPWPEVVAQSNLRLHLASFVAIAALAAAHLRWRPLRVHAWLPVAVLVGVWLGLGAERWLRLPTDQREQAIFVAWRAELPPGARVYYLSRAERRIVLLPMYRCTSSGLEGRPLDAAAMPDALSGAESYYVETSLCGTEEGREACRAIHEHTRMTLLAQRNLPAIESQPHLPYDRDGHVLRLWRIEPR